MIDSLAKSGIAIENRLRFSGGCMEHHCVQWVGKPGAGRCGLIDHALEALSTAESSCDTAALFDPRNMPLVRPA